LEQLLKTPGSNGSGKNIMDYQLLKDITVIFALSIPVIFLFLKLRLPSILGFLITGVFCGPHGLGLIQSTHEVEVLAEIGVVLLLFTIGIEFSLGSLRKLGRSVVAGGSLQVGITIAVVYALGKMFGHQHGKALFFGFLAALSSTAIVLKLLQERAEIDSPHGMNAVAILIFQDLMVVPLILVVPYLSDSPATSGEPLLVTAAKAVAFILLMIVAAKWVIPGGLHLAARTRSRELFLMVVVVICLATAWLTYAVGLSPALGAFMAGLIISESEYGHEAIGNILPFRDAFTSFFFVSVGMLVDLAVITRFPGLVTAIVAGIIVLKGLIAGLSVLVLRYPVRTAFLAGFSLAQVGEFSFILSKLGISANIISQEEYQVFLAVTAITMGITPFLVIAAPGIVALLEAIPLPRAFKGEAGLPLREGRKRSGHLVIVGYGVNGRNVAQAAKFSGIDYVIIEMNADTVRREKQSGENIFFGDATHEAVLDHADLKEAKVVVVAIADPAATRRVASLARKMSPEIYIIIRTRFFTDMESLYHLGANEVIPEEFETSVEIFSRVLSKYMVPHQDIEKLVSEIRSDGYEMFRSLSIGEKGITPLSLPPSDLEVIKMSVCRGSLATGKTLEEIRLRSDFGVTVLAVKRGDELISNPGGGTELAVNDQLYILGTRGQVAGVRHYFTEGDACAMDERDR
jgi:CPA2 family monovalent cation:H+ antiporter-2